MRFGARRRGVSTLIGGLMAIALFIVVVFTLTYFYSAALGGFLHEFQMAQTINYKNSEYLVVSYSFNSTLNTGNLTVTNAGKYPARVVDILKAPAGGGNATLIPENVTIWPGQSYTFAGVLQQGYHYAVITSYGNTWWSSFGVVNPVAGTYSLTIRIETIPGGDGGSTSPPPGTYYYSYGTEVTIGASPNPGYGFEEWQGTGQYSYTGTNETATIYTWDNMTETAVFVGLPQPVTFSEQGIPSGASVSPELLTVSYNGSTYQYGPSQLPVTLQIPTGTTVTYAWSSPVYGTGSYSGARYLWQSTTGLASAQSGSFTVPAGGGYVNATYGAQYQLTFQQAGLPSSAAGTVLTLTVGSSGGSYTVSGLPVSFWVAPGTSVSYSWSSPVYDSTPGIRYLWGSTTDNFGASLGQSGSFSMPAQGATVQGNYGSAPGGGGIQYLLTMQVDPSGAGSTNPAVGSYWEPAGAALSIGATPNSGWAFASWTGTGSGSYTGTNQYPSITMDGPITETANFYPTITFQQSGLPSGAPGTIVTVSYSGSTEQFTVSQLPATLAVPPGTQVSYSYTSPVQVNSGTRYVLTGVSGPSSPVTVDGPTTVVGTYTEQYLVQTFADPTSGGSTSPTSEWVSAGTQVSLSASTNSGWEFYGWTGTAGSSASNPWTITVNAPVNETASFYPGLTVSATSGGSVVVSVGSTTLGTVSGGSSATYYEPPGTTYTLDAVPNQNYMFSGWSGALSGTTDPASLTVGAPESVTANFVGLVQFNALTAYDAADLATNYNYWVAAAGQAVVGNGQPYTGQLKLVFDVVSAANGQTYTITTYVDPNSQGWFYTGVLTIGGGYGVWGSGVSSKTLTVYEQVGGNWIPVKTYSGWAWGVIVAHAETYVGQLQIQEGGTMTISVPAWDGMVLYSIHDSAETILLPQQTTVQLSATPDSGYYFVQFELAQGSAYNQPSNPIWTSTSDPYQWTTPASGSNAYSYGGYLTAEFAQTSLTFNIYSPFGVSVPFTLTINGPNGWSATWSSTTGPDVWVNPTIYLAFNTWKGVPVGTYSYEITPTSYDGYDAVPSSGWIVVSNTASQTISYGGQYYTVTFTESGLPSGTEWWVVLNGWNQSSTSSTITFSEPKGTYSWSAGPNPYYPGTNGVRYYSSDASGSLSVSGNTGQTVTWAEQYEVQVTYTPANAYSTGTQPAPSSGGTAETWVDAGSSFKVTAYPGQYWMVKKITAADLNTGAYVNIQRNWAQTGGVWYETGTVSSVNEPLAVMVPFAHVEVKVQESGLPGGATWYVYYPSGTVYQYAPAGQPITVTWDGNTADNTIYTAVIYANGYYYLPSPASFSLPTSENPNQIPTDTVSYTQAYPVTISSGDGGYVSWSLSSGTTYPGTSGTVMAGSSQTIYATYGTRINLQAYPAYSWSFVGWTTSGSVSTASGSNPAVLTVSGSGSVKAVFGIPVTFTESGLPTTATWSVTFGGVTQSATVGTGSSSITFYVTSSGSYSWSASNVNWLFWTYYPNPSSGTMDVPSQTSQTITYSTSSISYTWTPSGLPSSYTWGVTVWSPGGSQVGSWSASGGQSITQTFAKPSSGSYSYAISAPSGWSANPGSGSFNTGGSQTVSFTYSYTWSESGLPSGDTWYISVGGSTYSEPAGTSITVYGLSGSESWSTWDADGYNPSPGSGTVSGPGSMTISWTSSTYSYTWYESGLSSAALSDGWGISIGIQTWWSNTGSLTISGLSGSQSWSVDSPPGYTASPSSGSISGAGSQTITFNPIPISVSLSANPTSGNAPLKVSFSGSISGGSGQYTWTLTFGDGGSTGGSGSSVSASHTYSSAGTYTATLTATDSVTGQSKSASVTITVKSSTPPPPPPPSKYSVTFTESYLPPGYTWSVTLGGTTKSAGAGGSITFSGLQGTYSWSASAVWVRTKYGWKKYYPHPGSGSVSGPTTINIKYYP
ncbi:InlB B-repeat-containing protein [Conexivisphaera calida]|uniref:PKD domain-containing protein n=1 Tax=Conexivisphaera calida TaxID=1874277 RepID=A0A4P2VCW2_9ARCH|nr:PKD domain-containing protein [Conexivisphaera calida]BBE42429.1 hypothetical protein NAS2_1040 [Conexivisphaera calida]